MSLPRFSVNRPVFTTMVVLIVVVLGLVSFSRLKIDLLPSIELPTASVRTQFEGASPEVMERLVTQIVEEIVATVPGVEELTSTSSEGRSRVNVVFEWGTNIDLAALELQATLEDEVSELPDDIVRPRVSKFDIDSFPVVLLGIASPLDPVELTELVEDHFRYRFARIPGVAQADLWGGFDREVRVELDPDRLLSLGISLDRIREALRDANLDLPAGQIEDGRFEVTLRAPAEFGSLDEIRETVIARADGSPVRLGDVATVADTYEKLTRVIRLNGERGIRIAIRKKAGANTVEVSRAILDEIGEINRAYPQVTILPVINQGNFIQRSIENVARSVLYGGVLALLVLLFFLRNLRSTLIVGLAIPISIIATMAMIYFLGFTINLMTLGGLALGVGMMVDSSIVVLENIYRRRAEEGETRAEAAAVGAMEVGPAIVAATITTLVIFLPIVFVEGVSGVLFRDLAWVIVFALGCSLFVSLSVVPMLCSRLLRSREEERRGQSPWISGMLDWSGRRIEALENTYRLALRFVLDHRAATVGWTVVLLAGSVALFPLIGTEFLPPSDEGEVRVTGEMEVGTRLDLVDRQTRMIEEIVAGAVPEATSSIVSVRDNEGEMRISLVPASERGRSNTDIAEDLRQRLEGKIPGMEIRTRAPQGQFLLERLLGGEESLAVEIRGYDLETLRLLGARVEEAVRGIPGITDVVRTIEEGIPREEIRIDREKVADLGLTIRDVTGVIETAIAGSDVGEYRVEGESYRIFVQLKDAEKRTIEEILDLAVATRNGQPIPLRALVTVVSSRGPQEIRRKDQQRLAEVRINVAGRDMGSVARDVGTALAGIARPADFEMRVAGTFEEQQEAFRSLLVALLTAVLLVYMVLACQYESLLNPLVVMVSVPVAGIGVVLVLLLTNTTLNLQSGIGCIMLGGIVVNNAILLVDQAGRLQGEGLRVREAVAEAARRRLRPILMTSLTTILGLLPLALGIGEGADAQAPMARVVVGGLIGSSLITLLVVPAVYSLLHGRKEARS